MTHAGERMDVARTRLGLVRALRLVRDVDRRLDAVEFDHDLLESFTMGLLLPGELRDAMDLPTVTGAEVVLRDALGLHPPLADADLETLAEELGDSGWTSVTLRHRPTGLQVRSSAVDNAGAHEIARLMLARVVWGEALALVEERLRADDDRRHLLERIIVGRVTCDQVAAWIDEHRDLDNAQAMLADDLAVDVATAQQLLDGAMGLDALVRECRERALDAVSAQRAAPDAPQRCPSCGADLTGGWSDLRPGPEGGYVCPGVAVVYEQTLQWQGDEPLGSPVPIIGHSYRCGETVFPRR